MAKKFVVSSSERMYKGRLSQVTEAVLDAIENETSLEGDTLADVLVNLEIRIAAIEEAL